MTAGPPRVRFGEASEAGTVAALHASELPDGFLVSLGQRFLRRLYARIARSERAFLLLAETGDGDPFGQSGRSVDGFIAVAEDTGALYREFLRRDGVPAGLGALGPVLRSPRHTWETFRYGTGASAEDLPAAEVLAVAVSPAARGRGLGAALVSAATAELRARSVPAAQVVTAVDNVAALRMYESCGFRRHSEVEVHKGVAQAVLVWS